MTTKFWMPIGSSKLMRHPIWDFVAPVNSTGRGVIIRQQQLKVYSTKSKMAINISLSKILQIIHNDLKQVYIV